MSTKTAWQQRAKAAGLSQTRLAELLGRDDTTVYRALKEIDDSRAARYVKAAIIAAEIMAPDQRAEWLRRVAEETGGGDHSA